MLIEHLELFDKLLLQPGHKGYHVMKKHFKAYISGSPRGGALRGWSGAKELRAKLMQTESPTEAREILSRMV